MRSSPQDDTGLSTATMASAVLERVLPFAGPAGLPALLNASVAVTQIVSPAQPDDGHFVRLSDYLVTYQFATPLRRDPVRDRCGIHGLPGSPQR